MLWWAYQTSFKLNPTKVAELTTKIRESVSAQNKSIDTLQYLLEGSLKAYNDTLRAYETKLADFGIPIEELGFMQLDTKTSTIPAGLVTKY
jgi:hypothetical protein